MAKSLTPQLVPTSSQQINTTKPMRLLFWRRCIRSLRRGGTRVHGPGHSHVYQMAESEPCSQHRKASNFDGSSLVKQPRRLPPRLSFPAHHTKKSASTPSGNDKNLVGQLVAAGGHWLSERRIPNDLTKKKQITRQELENSGVRQQDTLGVINKARECPGATLRAAATLMMFLCTW